MTLKLLGIEPLLPLTSGSVEHPERELVVL